MRRVAPSVQQLHERMEGLEKSGGPWAFWLAGSVPGWQMETRNAASSLSTWLHGMDPEKLRTWFYFAQIGLGGTLVLGLLWLRAESGPPDFGTETRTYRNRDYGQESLYLLERGRIPWARRGLLRKRRLLRLSGSRLMGLPTRSWESLRTPKRPRSKRLIASFMKRYHPDLVGRPGTREWNDAQKIAEAINRAKEEMLAKRRSSRG